MLAIVFGILMIAVFGKLIGCAIKLTWGLAKILFSIVFLPIILIGLFIAGLVQIVFPLLVIIGIIALIL